MITGPEIEVETWKILKTKGNLDDELLDSIQIVLLRENEARRRC